MANSTFQPRQRAAILPRLPHLLAGLQQGHADVASFIFDSLPPLAADTVLHDLGCGLSRVSAVAVAACPPAHKTSLTIHATDETDALLARATPFLPEEHVTTSTMPSDALTFADGTFSHSIINVALPTQRNPPAVAAEMRRTLRPGGIAVATFWTYTAPGLAANATHDEFHIAAGRKPKAYVKPAALVPENMVAALVQGGFDPANVRVVRKSLAFEVDDLRAFTEAVWAVVGECEDGWALADEEQWERMMDWNVELAKGMKGMTALPGGGYRIEREVAVVIAQK